MSASLDNHGRDADVRFREVNIGIEMAEKSAEPPLNQE